ncbi:ABC transporter E family member 1-like [Oryza sativa Japonica Group]|uniref:ABC transporter E family member 1-like n=1 Tax=Oryza sativa subsp. japonica TaxID=39947 RepID=UPI0007754C64|nr:ABC transporter E family member 1-like [Oryza sativa Japonica Group]
MAARRLTSRVAVVDEDRCKPNKCGQECRRSCPVVKIDLTFRVVGSIALISEELCIGCGICVKKCPFGAITIINLPKELDKDTTHRFGQNSFKLHRLPVPIPGQVLGLVGINGIGKSTALNILAGQIKPNLGRYDVEALFLPLPAAVLPLLLSASRKSEEEALCYQIKDQ